MKKQNNAGFSLVEVLLAMVILAAVVIPVCSGIVLSVKVNTSANDVLQARHAVSSAVETLMAQGIPWDYQGEDLLGEAFAESGIQVEIVKDVASAAHAEEDDTTEATEKPAYFIVTVSDREEDPLVTVKTKIRAVEPPAETEPDSNQTPADQGGSQ